MATNPNPNTRKLANTATIAAPPPPRIMLVPMPAKLKKIAPELAKWEEDQQRAFDEYWQKTNAIANQTGSQLDALIRKG